MVMTVNELIQVLSMLPEKDKKLRVFSWCVQEYVSSISVENIVVGRTYGMIDYVKVLSLK